MAIQPVPDQAPPLRPRPPRQAPPHPLIGPAPRTDPSLVLTTQLQDLSILVGVGNSAFGVSRRPGRGILDRFASCARTALLQGLHPSQGHQGLGGPNSQRANRPIFTMSAALGLLASGQAIPSASGAHHLQPCPKQLLRSAPSDCGIPPPMERAFVGE